VGRVLAAAGAAAALVASFFLGALVFLTALGLFVVVAVGVAIRIWWLRRQFREQMESWEREQGASQGDVIEGEYRVVERRERSRGERR
jgi:membrane protein implicated in regulation of membrane protease activity